MRTDGVVILCSQGLFMGPYAWLANPYTFEEPMCTKRLRISTDRLMHQFFAVLSLKHRQSSHTNKPQGFRRGVEELGVHRFYAPLVCSSGDPANDRHWHRNISLRAPSKATSMLNGVAEALTLSRHQYGLRICNSVEVRGTLHPRSLHLALVSGMAY